MTGPRVTVFVAQGCHLCDAAVEVVSAVCGPDGFAVVDIGGDAALEARYRALLPVVEVDGERAFTYFVQPDALSARLAGEMVDR